ncbi:glycoside hydrolase family 130 protein [Chitinophaga sedimenti]|uniref:glycoside hydrolase family 130 protein n=1 Tax=Chitinophaga sedimenti TaxID=2033606 RepID=UPI00249E04C3|nr:glycosidase [Chitinophaga sedimenti]
MMKHQFEQRLANLEKQYEALVTRPNEPLPQHNGVYTRYKHPVITAAHAPVFWRYDLNKQTNPFLMERFGINAAFNAGAIKWEGKYILMVRVEGLDRKSFFAIAESPNGVDNFRFRDYPIQVGQSGEPDVNVYDVRLTAHEDGWVYGLFCTERKDTSVPAYDQSAAIAQCGIIRSRDLKNWERLSDLKTTSPQQRNVVLHPEFVDGKYAFYTRPQDGFIDAGSGGGIGFGLSASITEAEVLVEQVIDPKKYHTVYEAKNGQGPAPIKTPKGWLHLAHGVRNTAAGLRYVLYMFMTDLQDLTKVIYKPAGYFLAPEGEERVGDVSNVVFSNGWIADEDGKVFIYYASSDTRMHVAVSSIDQLLDYVLHTERDGFTSAASVDTLTGIIDKNMELLQAPKENGRVGHRAI